MRLSQEALVGVVSSKVRFSALAPWLWRRKKRVGVAAGRVFFTRSASRHRASISVSAGAYLAKSPAVHRHQPYLSYQIFSLRPLTGSSDGDLVGLQPMGLTRGEQHGEDDPSEPGHGSQDHHVAWLALLPRLVLLGWDELGAEFIQLAVRCFQLLIDQPDADDQHADMVARRLDHPGCDRASSGKVENQFLVGSVSSSGHWIRSHSSARTSLSKLSRCDGRTRRRGARRANPLFPRAK